MYDQLQSQPTGVLVIIIAFLITIIGGLIGIIWFFVRKHGDSIDNRFANLVNTVNQIAESMQDLIKVTAVHSNNFEHIHEDIKELKKKVFT